MTRLIVYTEHLKHAIDSFRYGHTPKNHGIVFSNLQDVDNVHTLDNGQKVLDLETVYTTSTISMILPT